MIRPPLLGCYVMLVASPSVMEVKWIGCYVTLVESALVMEAKWI